jgi:dolichol-phosphate mannosyltransferase
MNQFPSTSDRQPRATRPLRITVAAPVFNEESVLPEFYRRTSAVLGEVPGGPHEIVLVDDGSSDGSLEILEVMAQIDPRVRVISLSRNFGHQAALTAALDHATGDVVVVMDADLQDVPEAIPEMLRTFHQGFDVVYAVRRSRKESRVKRFCYAAFYRVIDVLADRHLPRDAGDFALLSARVVRELRRTGEQHRYLRGLRSWVGFRQTGIDVGRAAREAGETKYSMRKLVGLALDGIFSFSVMPLRAATWIGAATMGTSALFAAYSLIAKLLGDRSPPGFTALILAVTFLAGVQLLFLGVIGEYVGRIYQQVKQRPHYVVDRILANPDSILADPHRAAPSRQTRSSPTNSLPQQEPREPVTF